MTTMNAVTIKVAYDARRLLRLIAATTNENIMQVVYRLAIAEWDRLSESEKPHERTPDRNKCPA